MSKDKPTNPNDEELEEQLKEALYTYNMDTTAGGMNEEKAVRYYIDAIKPLITKRERLAYEKGYRDGQNKNVR